MKPKRRTATDRSATKDEHVEIPRTLNAAKRNGYKELKVKFADLSPEIRATFIKLAESGSRSGSLCGIGASPESGFWLVCYKDDSRRCKWVKVPKGSPIPDHI